MKLRTDMQFWYAKKWYGKRNITLFNLIKVGLKEGRKKLGVKLYIFQTWIIHCLRITKHEVFIAIGKLSDHEEVDTRLFALVEAAFIVNGKTVTIRSPSEDIDIIMLFLFHEFDGISILIDNGVGKSRKL